MNVFHSASLMLCFFFEKINLNRFAIHQILARNIEKINNPSSLIPCAPTSVCSDVENYSAFEIKIHGIINYFLSFADVLLELKQRQTME